MQQQIPNAAAITNDNADMWYVMRGKGERGVAVDVCTCSLSCCNTCFCTHMLVRI